MPAVAAPAPPLAATSLSYADLADLALPAPVVAIATIARAQKLRPDDSPGLSPGATRFYVQAEVGGLIRGASGLPAEVSYLVDLPADARGKPPKPKGAKVILFADRVAARPGELRLIAPDAQLVWSAETEAKVRAILTEALSASAPPRVTRVGNAFYVPGVLPGEGETQIFLQTADNRPVSLSILRRPDEQPRWAVALGEMVDEAAGPPKPETLLWYRLACTLPAALPASSAASLGAEEAALARRDYGVVIAGLGACERKRVK
ncbi:hypothetical protein [Sphingomonas sp. ID0503]|uniref:hypothetical protein n=1 Tax=Sphingomonas sp. ID0503 TaxID=3399691 RepID=UPI003AFA50B8